jgi:hypothetical protein
MDTKAEPREAARQHAGRALHVYQDEDGTVVLRGRLAPEVGALLLRALDAARETLYQRGRAAGAMPAATAAPTRPQQQADALALLAETALHHELDPGAPGERYQVVVHVDAAVLADPEQPGQSVLEEGSHVSAETSRRLACDASRVVMRHDEDGQVVEIGAGPGRFPRRCGGRSTIGRPELPLPWLPSASRPGPSRAPLGPGRPDDPVEPRVTVSAASPRVHEEGYQIARWPDGALQFRRPDGRALPDVPARATVPADPVAAVRARHQVEGPQLHARTGLSQWLGERLDVWWAIGVLHPEATV